MNTKILILLTALVSSFFCAKAQDGDEENLVPNPGFENAETRSLKKYGFFEELTENWFTATKAPADLYARDMKSDKTNIPKNEYGEQDAAEGNHYAGFRAYTKDKKLNRTYLMVQLNDELEKNQMYCVEFKISLADMSKYATNFIGVSFTDRKTIQPNTGAIVKDVNDIDVRHRSNKVMKARDQWETVCGTMIGSGNEEYMIIGCFGSNNGMEIEKMKRPRGAVGSQIYDAYYFIDDIKVFPIDAKSQCSCDPSARTEPDLIYGAASVQDENMSDSERVSSSAVYYAFLKTNITQVGQRTLDNIAELMKAHPEWKLEIIGHCDNDEFNESKINDRYLDMGKQRAEDVFKYLVGAGIDADRLIILTKENTDPANTRPTPLSMAQNRRVVFEIRK